jgi:hypothetical protein
MADSLFKCIFRSFTCTIWHNSRGIEYSGKINGTCTQSFRDAVIISLNHNVKKLCARVIYYRCNDV